MVTQENADAPQNFKRMNNQDIFNLIENQHKQTIEVLDAKFTHLSAVMQNGFEDGEKQRTKIIEHQKVTNGRVTTLEKEAIETSYFKKTLRWKLIGVIAIAVILAIVTHEFGILELLNIIK